MTYAVSYSFANFQANNPSKPLPGQRLDIELYNIQNCIGETEAYLAQLRGPLQDLVASSDAVPLVAVLQALADMVPYGVTTLTKKVPADPSNLVNIRFNHLKYMRPGDALYGFISGVFPTLDMTALLAAARNVEV